MLMLPGLSAEPDVIFCAALLERRMSSDSLPKVWRQYWVGQTSAFVVTSGPDTGCRRAIAVLQLAGGLQQPGGGGRQAAADLGRRRAAGGCDGRQRRRSRP